MYRDLHSHTYFSACGADEPERLIVKAIESEIDINWESRITTMESETRRTALF